MDKKKDETSLISETLAYVSFGVGGVVLLILFIFIFWGIENLLGHFGILVPIKISNALFIFAFVLAFIGAFVCSYLAGIYGNHLTKASHKNNLNCDCPPTVPLQENTTPNGETDEK